MLNILLAYADKGGILVLSLLLIVVYLFLQAQIGVILWLMLQVKDAFLKIISELQQLRETITELKTEFHCHKDNEVADYD